MNIKKHYINDRTGESTSRAALALRWHRDGDNIGVITLNENKYLYHITVRGAQVNTVEHNEREDENREHCKHIAKELDAYINGEIKRCPVCGMEEYRDWNEVGDKFKCINCGETNYIDDWEWLSEYDFLADAYDIEYRCTSRRELRSVRIMVACGGPNIYIDTASKDVELYWWNEHARYPLSYEAVEAVEAWAEQMWECC